MNKKTTATITWLRYYNFGSYLQAYGLQQVLISLGYANKIIADEGIIPPKFPIVTRIYFKLRTIISFPILFLSRKKYKTAQKSEEILYTNFRNRYLLVDEEAVKENRLATLEYDQYICGSDQIWHPLERAPLEPFYYARFTNKPKISYAASFGVSIYPDSRKSEFVDYTRNFRALSCREKIGCKIIKQLLDKEATYVLDPTLLITGDQWKEISEMPIGFDCSTKYALAYFLTPNKWYVNYAKEYAQKQGIKLISFYLRRSSPSECDEVAIAGPSEFVWLIENAELLLTDSFHGSVFATLMHTPFIGFQRFQSDHMNVGQNHRLIDFYNLVGIDERLIRDIDDCDRIPDLSPQNFIKMESNLLEMREISIKYLKESLAN